MAEDFTFSTCYMAYIGNTPYSYPADNADKVETSTAYQTGYHIIPNILWRHYATPKQWFTFTSKYEAYHVHAAEAHVFNMIPMTQQLAIQQTSTFTAFNNCVYGWGYTDKYYETSWYNYFDSTAQSIDSHNLAYKEGQIHKANSDTKIRYILPKYNWQVPHTRTSTDNTWANFQTGGGAGLGVYPTTGKPTGIFWDPLNEPGSIMELRPGKNTMSFHWNCHPCDENKWYNIDGLAEWWPYTTTGPYNVNFQRPQSNVLSRQLDPDRLSTRYQKGTISEAKNNINDYTIPNLYNCPIVPIAWFWQEMKSSIIQDTWQGKTRPDLLYCGTEYEQYHYPPTQWFTKLVPLFDDNGTHIACYANISIKLILHLKVKPRRSAIYAPTWGPFAWPALYSIRTRNMNFQPAMIRYRTGGARRTWQNIAGTPTETDQGDSSDKGHFREDPYLTSTNAAGTGAAGTYVFTQAQTKPEMIVTFNKDSQRVVIERPEPAKRRIERQRSPSPDNMVTSPIFSHVTHM
uniref:Capsid protein n=1 Tax=Parvoviridae sp. TaxID=1940570 RepID=A0A7D3UH50_9VIRU|nr:MAG: capsid protein [Parvoviridae sp.]